MVGDLPYRDMVKSLLTDAQEAERLGRREEAAGKLAKAAALQKRYAQTMLSGEARKAALEQAQAWEKRAHTLLYSPEHRPASRPPEGGQVSAQAQRSQGGEEDSLLNAVEAMIVKGSSVTWDDIAGLDEVKREIKMAFALNFARFPDGVKREPWRRILLYGPPGTGKTMLAASVAGSIPGATFFNAQWSSLASKWFGESERIVQLLYETARNRNPAVVFLDEVDAVAASRETGSESGAAKKVLSALLTALDGIGDKMEPPLVLTFAATNRPWALDAAFLSRFSKAIYVPLPDYAARKRMLESKLVGKGYKVAVPLNDLATLTEGYSGRDLETLCRQVVVNMVYEQNPDLTDTVDKGIEEVKGYEVRLRPLTRSDFENALKQVRPTVSSEYVALYEEWRKKMGY